MAGAVPAGDPAPTEFPRTPCARGVLHLLLDQPLGRAILALLAFGLAAYTLWLFVQAFVDPDANGTSFVGLVNRLGQVITGVAHAALMVEALRLAAGLSGLPPRLAAPGTRQGEGSLADPLGPVRAGSARVGARDRRSAGDPRGARVRPAAGRGHRRRAPSAAAAARFRLAARHRGSLPLHTFRVSTRTTARSSSESPEVDAAADRLPLPRLSSMVPSV